MPHSNNSQAWPFTHTFQTIVPITVLYGIGAGSFVALIGSPVVQLGDTTSVGERTGLLFSCTALGALAGPPISGAIRSSTGNWESVGYYAGKSALLIVMYIEADTRLGSMIMLAVLLMWITRILILKHPFKGIA